MQTWLLVVVSFHCGGGGDGDGWAEFGVEVMAAVDKLMNAILRWFHPSPWPQATAEAGRGRPWPGAQPQDSGEVAASALARGAKQRVCN